MAGCQILTMIRHHHNAVFRPQHPQHPQHPQQLLGPQCRAARGTIPLMYSAGDKHSEQKRSLTGSPLIIYSRSPTGLSGCEIPLTYNEGCLLWTWRQKLQVPSQSRRPSDQHSAAFLYLRLLLLVQLTKLKTSSRSCSAFFLFLSLFSIFSLLSSVAYRPVRWRRMTMSNASLKQWKNFHSFCSITKLDCMRHKMLKKDFYLVWNITGQRLKQILDFFLQIVSAFDTAWSRIIQSHFKAAFSF